MDNIVNPPEIEKYVEFDTFTEDENDIPITAWVWDSMTNPAGIEREYKLHNNSHGSYIVFHGKRIYLLVNSETY
jgi:hypothetical protein